MMEVMETRRIPRRSKQLKSECLHSLISGMHTLHVMYSWRPDSGCSSADLTLGLDREFLTRLGNNSPSSGKDCTGHN